MRTTDTGRTLKLDGAMLQNLALYRYPTELARISARCCVGVPLVDATAEALPNFYNTNLFGLRIYIFNARCVTDLTTWIDINI